MDECLTNQMTNTMASLGPLFNESDDKHDGKLGTTV